MTDRPDRAASPGESSQPGGDYDTILARYVDSLLDGEDLSPDAIVSAHPEFGDRLVEDLQSFIDPDQSFRVGSPGTPLGTLGDYTLRRQIGRGGMGVVYEAWENSIGRSVAVKVLPAGVAADTQASARFMREAQAAGKLNHPNVVSVYSMGVTQQTPYYAVAYVEGETLAQILARVKELEPESDTPFGKKDDVAYFANLAKAFADVADGLQHAHSKGVIHRDVKPSNLILDFEGRLRILDFGLARLEGQESMTLSGDVVGTPAYMSPEQARRQRIPIDHRTDVYSLGATMYETFTGRPPFRGKDHADTLSHIIERAPRPLRQSNGRVPGDLETIVLKCLRKEAGDRYGTAEALGQDLRRFARGDPIEARPQSALEKAARRLWIQRRVVLGIGVVLLVALVASVIVSVVIARARDRAQYDLYVARMRLATEDWRSGNIARFAQTLDRYVSGGGEPDRRGWEWFYLQSLRSLEDLRIDLGSIEVRTIDWSPDDRHLAAGGESGVAGVWDARSGELVRRFHVSEATVSSVRWSPDSSLCAIACDDGLIRIKSIDGASELEAKVQFEKPAKTSVSWSPQGHYLAGGSGTAVKVWGAENFEVADLAVPPLRRSHRVEQLAWSPSGDYLAAVLGSPHSFVVWETGDWNATRVDAGVNHDAVSLAWSSDGQQLATAGWDERVRVWQPGDSIDTPASVFDAGGAVYSLAWRPKMGAGALAIGRDGDVILWDMNRGEGGVTLRGHTGRVRSIAWDSDGTRIASASEDGSIRVWNPERQYDSVRLEGEAPARWSPDGRWLAVERDEPPGSLAIVDPATGEVESTVQVERPAQDLIQGLSFSSDGQLLAFLTGRSGRENFYIWDWRQGVALHRSDFFWPGCVVWHPDPESGLLFLGSRSGKGSVWDWKRREEIRAVTGCAAAWSPDGARLALKDRQCVKVVDAQTWEELHVFDEPHPNLSAGGGLAFYLSWSPDSKQLAAGTVRGEVVIRDVRSGEVTRTLRGHRGDVLCVSWHPHEARLATGGQDRTIKTWDTQTGEELITLRGHKTLICSLQWSPDGMRLLSAGADPGSVRVWDASRGYNK